MHHIVELMPEALGIEALRVHSSDEFIRAGRDERPLSHRTG
jgi:hypothetical protein